ncbi:MAG TPA: nitroreductase family deazaflavin-dependent oxidoreductase [Anaerolineae bacterium]|nr:nitroreductase family deazaflavin-dependent oxidoreductase [Anaerolineae bacterium]HIP73057.1 nitroreductase family deazaflavin-dependent oxidoreductase [Anaerolineae bacterium]
MGNDVLLPQPKKRWWHKLAVPMASWAVTARIAVHAAGPLDTFLYRKTGGRMTLSSVLAGLPVILVTTTGAKSGQPRTVPLLGIPDGENIILIASNWGGRKNPAWYYNLKANPEAMVRLNGQNTIYTAKEVTGKEKERCWTRATDVYPGYNAYQKRSDDRTIPVMLLSSKTT